MEISYPVFGLVEIVRLFGATQRPQPGWAHAPDEELRALVRSVSASRGPRFLREIVMSMDLGSAPGALDDDAIVERVVRGISRGELGIRRAPNLFGRQAVATPEAATVETSGGAASEQPDTHWVEIQVVDEDGVGVAGVRCQITLPDGRIEEMRTNRVGSVYVSGIDEPGACELAFPELDQDAWALA